MAQYKINSKDVDGIVLVNATTGEPYTSSGGGGGGGSGVPVVTYYTVTTAFTGAAVGNRVRELEVYDSTASTLLYTLWTNETTQTVISGTPPASSLAPASTDALTNAQLRATPVPMIDQSAIDKAEQIRLLVVTLSAYVDNIESLIGTSNTLLTAGNANTDQIEVFLTTLNSLTTDVKAQVTAINSNTDQLEGLLTQLNTKLPTDLSGGRLKVESMDKDMPFTVDGITRDPTKDIVYRYSDGTSQRIYQSTDLVFAGVGAIG
jgi:hypothetical protein